MLSSHDTLKPQWFDWAPLNTLSTSVVTVGWDGSLATVAVRMSHKRRDRRTVRKDDGLILLSHSYTLYTNSRSKQSKINWPIVKTATAVVPDVKKVFIFRSQSQKVCICFRLKNVLILKSVFAQYQLLVFQVSHGGVLTAQGLTASSWVSPPLVHLHLRVSLYPLSVPLKPSAQLCVRTSSNSNWSLFPSWSLLSVTVPRPLAFRPRPISRTGPISHNIASTATAAAACCELTVPALWISVSAKWLQKWKGKLNYRENSHLFSFHTTAVTFSTRCSTTLRKRRNMNVKKE